MVGIQTKTPSKKRKHGRLYNAFLVIALLGGCLPILLSNDFTHEFSMIGSDFKRPLIHNSNSKAKDGAQKESQPKPPSRLAGLDCTPWGGPANEAAEEMVYWEDIPQDSTHVSPFYKPDGPPQYFSFERDNAGWNNVRMSMETLMGIALAMGRTLVIPPAQEIHFLGSSDENQKNEFSFSHFFPTDRINAEQDGFGIISTEEYLNLFMEGKFTDKQGKTLFPPGNRTNWDGAKEEDMEKLNEWLRDVSTRLKWRPEICLAAFAKSTDPEDSHQLTLDLESVTDAGLKEKDMMGKPPAVDAGSRERMHHSIAERKKLCLYDSELQKAQRVHFPFVDQGHEHSRMITHFYGFLFFQDWKEDLWMKRFMRDHMRYVDEIQCAAARVVNRIRAHVHQRTGGNSTDFYSLHIRRGDFQSDYKFSDVSGKDIYEKAARKIPENSTVFIATDEENDDFFRPLETHYNVLYLEDFKRQLHGLNSNYFGMIDQLVASRGTVFMGCYLSTFTGYINRLRGYHADAGKMRGYYQGIIESYYYSPTRAFDRMRTYFPIWPPIWGREFPASWRLIDKDIDQ